MKTLYALILVVTVSNVFAESFIRGTLTGQADCASPSQIWISKAKTLFFQAEIPIGGTFEFSLLPGAYDIVASTSNNCIAKDSVKISKNEIKKIQLLLKKQ